MAAWDRQPNEPPKAYSRFCLYRDLGPERSLAKCGEIAGIHVTNVEKIASLYHWVDRVDKWDAHVRALHDRAYLTEVTKRGKQRAQAFLKLLARAATALDKIDLEKATLSHVAAAMKVATEGMRLEEGLETSRVVMEVQDARTILSRLPAEFRGGLCALLEAGTDSGADTGSNSAVPLGISDGED